MLSHEAADAAGDGAPRYRSGAVARMVRMPVATLRIWERRYRVTASATTAAGHRLYSGSDVQRLALLKQLTGHGHAIGAIANLDREQLQQVASTHASTVAAGPFTARHPAHWKIAIVGRALARRLQHPALRRRLGPALAMAPAFENLALATAAGALQQADLLLVHATGLRADSLPAIVAAREALRATHVAVVYRYASTAVCNAFVLAGVALMRDPQAEMALYSWLDGLGDAPAPSPFSPLPALIDAAAPAPDSSIPPRRYDDATLADFAGLSSTIGCECPRHVAELLTLLSQFEIYSAECRHDSPSDAGLHAYLQGVAGVARAHFETALERVAIHEGLVLPG